MFKLVRECSYLYRAMADLKNLERICFVVTDKPLFLGIEAGSIRSSALLWSRST